MKSKKSILCMIPVVTLFLAMIVAGGGQQAVAASSAEFAKVKADWVKVVEAAKKEGTLTAYGRFPDSTIAAMEKAWKAQYPDIKVNIIGIEGTALIERMKAEQV
jgi:iron(III) transport system substrate-binding protein